VRSGTRSDCRASLAVPHPDPPPARSPTSGSASVAATSRRPSRSRCVHVASWSTISMPRPDSRQSVASSDLGVASVRAGPRTRIRTDLGSSTTVIATTSLSSVPPCTIAFAANSCATRTTPWRSLSRSPCSAKNDRTRLRTSPSDAARAGTLISRVAQTALSFIFEPHAERPGFLLTGPAKAQPTVGVPASVSARSAPRSSQSGRCPSRGGPASRRA